MILQGSDRVTEKRCGPNFAYILHDPGEFLPTEYRFLQSPNSSSFVQCMKMLYNGQVELYYLIERYKPLAALLKTLDADSFISIAANLLSAIIEVQSIGFLVCQSIELSADKIFVDPANLETHLTYLPIRTRLHPDYASFENMLRANLVAFATRELAAQSFETADFVANLADPSLNLEELVRRTGREPVRARQGQRPTLRLIAPNIREFYIDRDEFILGQNAYVADGIIDFNKAVSRIHCKVIRTGSGFFVEDLESANGTYVNDVQVVPGRPVQINHGDVLRLANSNFFVELEQGR